MIKLPELIVENLSGEDQHTLGDLRRQMETYPHICMLPGVAFPTLDQVQHTQYGNVIRWPLASADQTIWGFTEEGYRDQFMADFGAVLA